MEDLVKVTIGGKVKEYKKGTTYLNISKEYQGEYDNDIILVQVDNNLSELHNTVERDCKLEFVTTKDKDGKKTYNRGLIIVMLKAIYNVLGKDIARHVSVEYSVSNGLYCELYTKDDLAKEDVAKIKKEMEDIVARDLPIEKKTISTDDATKLFHEYGMYDKEKLFKYRRASTTNIYNLDGFEDYYYGYMPTSTGILRYFDLVYYEGGIVLVVPTSRDPKLVEGYKPQPKLFYTLKDSNKWSNNVGIGTVGDLNNIIVKGNINEFIMIQEALQEAKISEIAKQIKESKNSKFVMIAGPSSSGKTTFSHRLSVQLRTLGLNPHPIVVDNYYRERTEENYKLMIDEYGNPDYESLNALDVDLFNEHMTDLLNGKTIDIPRYNFITGRREYKGNFIKLGPEDILVIEGIHGLNDDLSYSLPRDLKFKIYISALSTLNVDEHNRISTTDGRLLRRIVRDARTRGSSAQDTIGMWPSVRRGEDKNIFPFQEEADVMFNSALIYELAVLKPLAEPLLFDVDRKSKAYIEAKRLLKFLDYFLSLGTEHVPNNSILREFVGGSCFKDA
ncbi:MAG: nucleoside kinase [Clostridiales bacterium]|nr:nucleoside kinase [Clostridiales bacterium]